MQQSEGFLVFCAKTNETLLLCLEHRSSSNKINLKTKEKLVYSESDFAWQCKENNCITFRNFKFYLSSLMTRMNAVISFIGIRHEIMPNLEKDIV